MVNQSAGGAARPGLACCAVCRACSIPRGRTQGCLFADGMCATGTVRGQNDLLADRPWVAPGSSIERARHHVREEMRAAQVLMIDLVKLEKLYGVAFTVDASFGRGRVVARFTGGRGCDRNRSSSPRVWAL